MLIFDGYTPVTWRIISADSASAAVKQPLRNKLIMLWKKLNNLSASLKQQPVLGSNKSFLKFQLQHQSWNLPSEGRSCYRRAGRTVRHVDREFNNTILLIMIPSTSAASNNTEHRKRHRTGRNVFVVSVITTGGATVLKIHPFKGFPSNFKIQPAPDDQ